MTDPVQARPGALPVRALKPAYAQVADQLRELIVSGALQTGDRLPSEAEMCQQFGTSRSTIREALRSLSSQNLIRAKRGASGGITVAAPTHGEVIAQLDTSLGLLAITGELTVEELLDARRLLEVPAAGMAARHADDEQIERMRSFIPDASERLTRDELFERNWAFHETVMLASGNRLLHLMGRPIFMILRRRFLGAAATGEFLEHVVCDHEDVVNAIASRDPERAEAAMADHLGNLAPSYRSSDALGDAK
jgi:GntR family transcriptional regulator, transcriptional repressor for pyruvate dehydrogenase complex